MRTVTIKADYIWIGGTQPAALLRPETKILRSAGELPIWAGSNSFARLPNRDMREARSFTVAAQRESGTGDHFALATCRLAANAD